MAFDPISGLLSAGAGLLNFFGGQSAQDKAIAAQTAINDTNWQRSLQMAKNSIQYRVQDATKAGVSPLYALGAPTMSFAPAQVGAAGVPFNAMAPLAGAMRDLGQDVSRAGAANDSSGAKVASVMSAQTVAANNLRLENMGLQNQILKSRLAVLNAGTPPGYPDPANPSHPLDKPEKTPPLAVAGREWKTDVSTAPAKAWEDRYGDDGPASWLMPFIIGDRDIQKNMDYSAMPGNVVRWMYNQIKEDVYKEYRNARHFFGRPRHYMD